MINLPFLFTLYNRVKISLHKYEASFLSKYGFLHIAATAPQLLFGSLVLKSSVSWLASFVHVSASLLVLNITQGSECPADCEKHAVICFLVLTAEAVKIYRNWGHFMKWCYFICTMLTPWTNCWTPKTMLSCFHMCIFCLSKTIKYIN